MSDGRNDIPICRTCGADLHYYSSPHTGADKWACPNIDNHYMPKQAPAPVLPGVDFLRILREVDTDPENTCDELKWEALWNRISGAEAVLPERERPLDGSAGRSAEASPQEGRECWVLFDKGGSPDSASEARAIGTEELYTHPDYEWVRMVEARSAGGGVSPEPSNPLNPFTFPTQEG